MFFRNKSIRYYIDIINENKGKDYDYILIIKCDMAPISILESLRTVFPNAKMCLYLWDSVKNIRGVKSKFQFFDVIHSFDLEDCKKYEQLKFRPLFYGDQYIKSECKEDYKYDISFCGTIHSDRYAIVKQIQAIAKGLMLKSYWFLYLQSKFIFSFYKLVKREFKGVSRNVFSFDKLTANEIASIVDESKVVLDIQHPKQSGLTMRTIEMIGMKKKFITTNQNIIQYDFYNPNNILVIDRKNPKLNMSFFELPFEELPNEIYEKYGLKSWILEVLG